MRYIIISDIHGALNNLETVLNNEHFDKIILLGDILAHGPRNPIPDSYNPMKVASLLNNHKENIIAIKGNCDADVDNMVLEFPLLDTACLVINDTPIYMMHGHNDYYPNLNKGILLFGHSHVQCLEKEDDVYYINPGSISIPKDDKPGYIILDDNSLSFKDIHGNTTKEFKID